APRRRILGALAAASPVAMSALQVAAATGIPQARSLLDTLERLGLAERLQEGFRPAGDRREGAEASSEPEDRRRLVDWALAASAALAGTGPGGDEDVPLLVRAALLAGEAGRPGAAVDLARALEGRLALSGRWGSWKRVLQAAVAASVLLGDEQAHAWALHALGSGAMALEEYGTASTLLHQALQVREAIGDTAGAAASRANLDVLRTLTGAPPPSPAEPPEPPKPEPPEPELELREPEPAPARRWLQVGVGAAVVGALVALGVFVVAPAIESGTVTAGGGTTVVTSPITTSSTAGTSTTTTTLPSLSVSGFDRPRIAQGATAQPRALRGQGFRSGMTVKAESDVSVTVLRIAADGRTADVELTVNAKAADGRRSATVSLGTQAATCKACLTIVQAPVITRVAPRSAYIGQTTTLTITGLRFTTDATVSVSGRGVTVAGYDKRDSSTIVVRVAVGGHEKSGKRDVTVTTPEGGVATLAEALTLVPVVD
ncbi:MAG: IPT/TIG domain-containing protein, partial [Acidimicrobiales bacterium]